MSWFATAVNVSSAMTIALDGLWLTGKHFVDVVNVDGFFDVGFYDFAMNLWCNLVTEQ